MDFTAMAKGLAVISIGLIGVIMAAGAFFPQQAEQYKKQLLNVIIGLVLVGISTALVGFF